jgi:cyclophilin family peptidyl-prolyl cis-trans isomerase
MANKNIIIIVAVIAVAALALWGVSRVAKAPQNINNETTNANMENTNQQANANSNTAADSCVRDFKPEVLKEAQAPTEQFVTFTVKDYGTFKIQLFPKDAPKASENMARLAKAGYYDCLTFHRVAHNFVVQTGDPTGTGSGGDSAFGGTFADELNPATPSFKTGYVKGTVAMANSGPNTNNSQFFITLTDANAMLGKLYTIFGKVVSGQDVIDKIGKVEVEAGPFGSGDGAPLVPVVIEKAVLSAK